MLSLKPPSDLALLYNQFNNTSPEKKKLPWKCCWLQVLWHWPNWNFKSSQQTQIYHLLKCENKVFDTISVSETRNTKQTSINTNINLKNYAIEFTPTESSAGGRLLYIASDLSYKPRPDFNIYKANQLEYTFVQINNRNKSDIVIGCLFEHPSFEL